MGDQDGLEIRAKSMRLFFVWRGERFKERFTVNGKSMPPTSANILHARRTAERVRKAIDLGTFRMADFFPDSPRARGDVGAGILFGKACEAWLETKGRLAKKTQDQYRNALGVWRGLLGDNTPLETIGHARLAQIIGGHAWASNKLLANYLIPLRGVFALAGRSIELDDPTRGIQNPKHQAPQPDPLDDAETEEILADMLRRYPVQVWAYFTFAFFTGMRPEEQIALRWADVDWRHKTIRVERARTAGQVGPLKTYAARDVELVDRALEALQAMRPITELADQEIFQNPVTRRPWHDERSQRDHYWTPTLKRLRIRRRRAYQTRHTFATRALMSGCRPAWISRQLGHKNAQMLFRVYAKWIDRADNGRERDRLNEASSPRSPHAVASKR